MSLLQRSVCDCNKRILYTNDNSVLSQVRTYRIINMFDDIFRIHFALAFVLLQSELLRGRGYTTPLQNTYSYFRISRNHRCKNVQKYFNNSGKITNSKEGTPLWCPRSRGISYPFGTKLHHKKLETLRYHMVTTRSLYLTWHWIRTGSWRTDRRTDGQNSHS